MEDLQSGDRFAQRRQLLGLGVAAPIVALAAGQAFAAPADKARREANKALVMAYIDATDRGDLARIDALVSPDVKWWIVSRPDFDRAMVMKINARRFDPAQPRQSTVIGVAAEDDRVAVEYETRQLRHGEQIFVVYHTLFEVRDNAIVSIREWTDPRVTSPRYTTSQIAPAGQQPWPAPLPGEVDEAQTRAVAFAFLNPGPQNLSKALLAPGYRWWVNGRPYDDMFSYFAKIMPAMKANAETPISYHKGIPGMTVEGERAAVLINTDAIYPTYDYINRFLCVVRVRGGKVIELREHGDYNASVKAGFPDT
jgi:ketosteroid isomerase-like protein